LGVGLKWDGIRDGGRGVRTGKKVNNKRIEEGREF
jgi:hypothetical protein